MNKIKLLVVDDSPFIRKILIDRLSENKSIEVIGYATNGIDAIEKIKRLNPNVVTSDVEMPVMGGIELLKRIMKEHPVPVVLVSSLNISVFEALSAGAVDFVRKPDASVDKLMENFIRDLTTKVLIASTAKVKPVAKPSTTVTPPLLSNIALNSGSKTDSTIIAIGASTGGTEATLTVLKGLPANTPGILITQHMPPGFTKMYADRLDKLCAMEVREAKHGDTIKRGVALIAPGDAHMRLVKTGYNYTVHVQPGEKVSGHCPSVDVLFESVAKVSGRNSVGVILTGMGRDGAAGLLQMKTAGAFTVGQDQASCVVYGMPMEAFKLGAVMKQASCDQIANIVKTHLNKL